MLQVTSDEVMSTSTIPPRRLPEDLPFMQLTDRGWMMFQYLVSALATGATVVMYEGSPLKRPESMWETIDELGVTVFGTSAKYIEQISVSFSFVVWIELKFRNTTLTSSRNIAYRPSVKSSQLVRLYLLICSTSCTRISSPTFFLDQLRVEPISVQCLRDGLPVFPSTEARYKLECLACECNHMEMVGADG
jgi:hypothetical protein